MARICSFTKPAIGISREVTNWHLVKYNGFNSATVIDTGTINAADAAARAMVGVNCGVQPFSQIVGHFQSTMMEADLQHVWRAEWAGIGPVDD